ncbi:MAG: TrmH family RNA methyltransferase [Oscillospiraceae bacterium]
MPWLATALTQRARDIRQAELSQCAVVIGSEGQGVNRLFLEHCQEELIIPMNPRCESLSMRCNGGHHCHVADAQLEHTG